MKTCGWSTPAGTAGKRRRSAPRPTPQGGTKTAQRRIAEQLDTEGVDDPVERNLGLQNRCPLKMMTSGKEERAVVPFEAGERLRYEARTAWWNEYTDAAFCVLGHYSRTSPQSQNGGGLPLFPDDSTAPVGQTMCIDLGVGGRSAERRGDQTLFLRVLCAS